MASTSTIQRTGIDAVIHELLHSTFGLLPDELAPRLAALVEQHTSARDVRLLVADLDQVVLTSLSSDEELFVDWGPAGQAYRDEQPVEEVTADGRRLWLPILDSAERVGVLGLVEGSEVPIDEWLSLASLVGELTVSKSAYGDVITRARRRQPASLAAEMRWALLPPLTFSSPRVGISGILQPSHSVAGDAFDYAVNRSVAHLAILDAMGHGLLAARLANLAVSVLRNARRHGAPDQEALTAADAAIDDQFDGAPFVTAQALTLDLETGTATVRTAGHPPPALLRKGRAPEVIRVEPGLPLGIGPSEYAPVSVELDPGDAILLLSDGVYEARSAEGDSYGWDRILAGVHDRLSAGDRLAEVLRRSIRDVVDFQDDSRPVDDATLILVRWRPDAVGEPDAPQASQTRHAGSPAS